MGSGSQKGKRQVSIGSDFDLDNQGYKLLKC